MLALCKPIGSRPQDDFAARRHFWLWPKSNTFLLLGEGLRMHYVESTVLAALACVFTVVRMVQTAT
jgi:hypothetical protein